MRCNFFIIIFIGFHLNLFSQELDGEIRSIPAESTLQKEKVLHSTFQDSQLQVFHLGHFQVRTFSLPDDMGVHDKDNQTPIDILALGKAKEQYKQSRIRQIDNPSRQLQQIRSKVRVFGIRSSYNRANDDLHFYGKNTPDGGIKNEATEDIRQPFINPYYNSYRRGYRRYSQPRNGFYLYRR